MDEQDINQKNLSLIDFYIPELSKEGSLVDTCIRELPKGSTCSLGHLYTRTIE